MDDAGKSDVPGWTEDLQEIKNEIKCIIDITVDCSNFEACEAIKFHLKNIRLYADEVAAHVAIHQQHDQESHVLLQETSAKYKCILKTVPYDKRAKYAIPYFYEDALRKSFKEHNYGDLCLPPTPPSRETPPGKTN
jgi:hypothetical protein